MGIPWTDSSASQSESSIQSLQEGRKLWGLIWRREERGEKERARGGEREKKREGSEREEGEKKGRRAWRSERAAGKQESRAELCWQ